MMKPATAENGWVSTIGSKNPEVIAKARHIIESNLYCGFIMMGVWEIAIENRSSRQSESSVL